MVQDTLQEEVARLDGSCCISLTVPDRLRCTEVLQIAVSRAAKASDDIVTTAAEPASVASRIEVTD